jgi:hypothetical protein
MTKKVKFESIECIIPLLKRIRNHDLLVYFCYNMEKKCII